MFLRKWQKIRSKSKLRSIGDSVFSFHRFLYIMRERLIRQNEKQNFKKREIIPLRLLFETIGGGVFFHENVDIVCVITLLEYITTNNCNI